MKIVVEDLSRDSMKSVRQLVASGRDVEVILPLPSVPHGKSKAETVADAPAKGSRK